MLAMVVVQAPATALAVLLMDKAGRRPLLTSFRPHYKVNNLPLVVAIRTSLGKGPEHSAGSGRHSEMSLSETQRELQFLKVFVALKPDLHWIFLTRYGRNTMGYNVRDLSHKHERNSRKPGDPSQLAWLVDHLVRLQLPLGVEPLR
ncbi:hypothetical protein C2845_PM08G08070 [Panicum miliaceum]|uniref:Uncharacterized protein n=1 Tax=Panicum miliaceum TaxID=4540 RepID=A0A3L6R3L4_PANMI|nr:hypothetical protein C2845_PM08G08070 [Panicum miliaceum]